MIRASLPVALLAAIAGCAQMPTGPSVAASPGPYKPFEVFVEDDAQCRGWAGYSIGQPGNDEAARAFAGSAVVGTAIGALAGAAIGGDRAVGAGAAAGAITGSAIGAQRGAAASWDAQRRYDLAYQQCMYAKGNAVPGLGGYYSVPLPPRPRR